MNMTIEAFKRGGGSRPGRPDVRLGVLATVYLVQDIGYSFLLVAFPAILRAQGVPLGTLALTNAAGVFFVLKFLWAPLVDRFGLRCLGHYRSWLLVTQAVALVALAVMALLDPLADLAWVAALLAVVLAATGMHEIAVNGFAASVVDPEQRPAVGGLQLAAASAGLVAGSGGALLLYAALGWSAAVLAVAALFAVPLAVLGRFREPQHGEARKRTPPLARSQLSFLRHRPRAVWTLLVTPAYACGGYLAQALLAPLLLRAGWSLTEVALVQNTLGSLASVAAGPAAAQIIRRCGRRRALTLFGAIQAAALLGLLPAAIPAGPAWLAAAAVLVLAVASGAAFAAVYTVALDLARPQAAASDLTLQLAGTAAVRFIAGTGGLALAGALGFLPVLAGGAVAVAAGTAVTERWARRHVPAHPAAAAQARGRDGARRAR